jgi:DNA-binding Xre family transcriptional regulator
LFEVRNAVLDKDALEVILAEMAVLTKPERLRLIYKALEEAEPCSSEAEMLRLLDFVFDLVEDVHSGVTKNPDAASSRAGDGRMYSPDPSFRLPNVEPSCYRQVGHKTWIGKNGSLRIFKKGADLADTLVFEKRGADGKGFWEDRLGPTTQRTPARTTTMQHVEEMIRALAAKVPGIRTETEASENPRGPVWVNVSNGTVGAVIEWRQGMGFGLTSLPTESQGEASDEVYDSPEALVARLEVLLQGKERTQPRKEADLRELRERHRVSQDELAQRLGVSQPNVAKMEHRSDMSVARLRSVVEAIGGHLEIAARFGDELVRITQFDTPGPTKTAAR